MKLYNSKLIPLSLLSLFIACWVLPQQVNAQAISPMTGGWVITDENNGEPGRGLQLEVQNGVLVLSFYGYLGTGSARWWIAAGSFSANSNELVMDFTAFQGGTPFGGNFSSAESVGSAGQVTVRFSNIDVGEICLPNEPCKEMRAFNFGFSNNAPALLGLWVANGINSETDEAEGWVFNFDETEPSPFSNTIDAATGSVRFPWEGAERLENIECHRFDQESEDENGVEFVCDVEFLGNTLQIGLDLSRNSFSAGVIDTTPDESIQISAIIGFRVIDDSGRFTVPN